MTGDGHPTIRWWRTLASARHSAVQARNLVRSRWILRDCDRLGHLSRLTEGDAIVQNLGTIEIGAHTRLMGRFVPIELRTGHGGHLVIGDRVVLNYGTSIHVAESVHIGDDVDMGPYCLISDADVGALDSPDVTPPEPVWIGNDVWLATRVTVRPGAVIGEGTVVTAGSVVEGELPARVVAAGNPARVVRRLDAETDAESEPLSEQEPPLARTIDRRGLLVSDFTIDPLQRHLEAAGWGADVAPFGSVVPTLMSPESEGTDFAVVWTLAQSVLPSFARLLRLEDVDDVDLVTEVDWFADLVIDGLSEYRIVLVPTWTVSWHQRGRGLVDARPGGVAWGLGVVNRRLMERFADVANAFVLDAQRWSAASSDADQDPRRWYLGKIPVGESVFESAAREIVAASMTLEGGGRKMIVVDLDNTLWGGIVGDDGWEALRLGGHDGAGEAFVDFQRALKVLRERGILLTIASKNDEHVALEAIDRHDQMILRRDDFADWRINWSDKAANIADMVSGLNLGLQSVVFLDDNPYERGRVREALPEVLVPEWPTDPVDYVAELLSLTCFDTLAVSDEDRRRTAMYAANRERSSMQTKVASLDDWLHDLGIVVTVDPLSTALLPRAVQLLNKTNQMNLRTRRFTEPEFAAWADEPGHAAWCVSVSDRFGDAGLTGIMTISTSEGSTGDGVAELTDFVLSCRVFGRGVEATMLSVAERFAVEAGATSLVATFVRTAKNDPCQRFLDHSDLDKTDDSTYSLPIAAERRLSPHDAVEVVVR